MFRSNLMQFYNIIMPRENAYDIFNALGHLGILQVNDSDPNLPLLSRPFANYIKRCDELLFTISSIFDLAPKLDQLRKYHRAKNFDNLMNYFQILLQKRNQATHTYFNEIEYFIQQKNAILEQHLEHYNRLLDQYQYLQEYQFLLSQTKNYLGKFALQEQDIEDQLKFDYFTGTINSKDTLQFKKVIFRITKGNAIVHLANMEIMKMKLQNQVRIFSNCELYQESLKKTIFVVVFPTSSINSIIKQKIRKICDVLCSTTFPMPTSHETYTLRVIENASKLQEIGQLLSLTLTQIMNSLDEFFTINVQSGCSVIEEYRLYILREKQLYLQLNKLKMQGNIFIGQLWIPTQYVLEIENCLTQLKITNPNLPAGQLQQIIPPSNTTFPTYFKLNDFTKQFQEIVDLYGIPRYQEFNPAIFACITFPFFFGVMFGDIGHGLCIFIFGLYLCKYREQYLDFSSYRYMIILMGAFSIYMGFIYNEFFGLQLNLFGSCYIGENKSLATLTNTDIRKQSCIYTFGIDPIWQNTLSFTNSLKMKLSVIVAYLHMTLGLICSGLNYIYSNDRVGLYGKFIPQLLLLSVIFGYMDFLILYKWFHTWISENPPSIVNTLIDMVTRWGHVSARMWDFTGNEQESIQKSLMFLAVLSIPWMWFSKIFSKTILKRGFQYQELADEQPADMRSVEIELQLQTEQNSEIEMQQPLYQKEKRKFGEGIGDLLVHESIETIEFILGTVSNTASYLRLWALSLAHSQLAEVFFELILAESVENAEIFDLMVRFPTFLFITFGVLLCMDSLECFLHSLRLHWLEFQSKFFKGDGIPFEPYSFKNVFIESIIRC